MPGCIFLGFLDGGFCETGALPVGASPFLATIGASPLMTRGCLCLFLACFGFFLALAGLDYWGRRPYPCPYGLFGFLAWVWPGLLFLAFVPVLAFCPFVLGCAVRCGPPLAFFFACWPLRRPWLFAFLFGAVRSGMALWWPFVCAATLGAGGLLSGCAALLVGGLVDGGASGDIQGCTFVQLEPH